ncbi:helix-turn-helix domain-containing protein [Blastococcus sp. BMG 814]|uniref:Helix-turn-helix domain-containing protein n=1 Tax=Blastococcus carthaginiensis TaxID=3050034 RepID=A0ABT9IF46_9ACTN|nr:helix-turn-helix domain-containing protein [Blastococcus carthaginiensis]MDP5184208.1 helix-turn-helix domain-containing protein [Blastococcus carthaginiensis]
MKPDSSRSMDHIERAHLVEPGDASHVIHRYPAAPEFEGLLQRFWIPVWSVPPGQEAPQRVLQYPVALLVVSSGYARFYGVVSGLSETTLTGEGWAVGVMCAPAAGALVAGGPMSGYTDRFVDVADVLGAAGERLTARVRAAMVPDPRSPDAHGAAMAAFGDALRGYLPVDDEGRLVNEVVAFVEGDREVVRVAQVCDRFGLSERALQRLVHRRLGLTPKWLVQRRRLQEAAERLRGQPASMGEVAAVLGYADQAHFTRDFARVTGTTPGRFAARHAPGS